MHMTHSQQKTIDGSWNNGTAIGFFPGAAAASLGRLFNERHEEVGGRRYVGRTRGLKRLQIW